MDIPRYFKSDFYATISLVRYDSLAEKKKGEKTNRGRAA